MTSKISKVLTRRSFLRSAGGVLVLAAGGSLLPRSLRRTLSPVGLAGAADPVPDLFYAGTDGWMSLPTTPAIPPFHPDVLAPAPFTTYIFGFRNITGLDPMQIANQKMKAQHPAPTFWARQFDPATGANEFRVKITNLGLQMRPDLTDAHTLHWHGFRNVIPFFDGEPSGSIGVPVGREFTYVYRARDAGTYMFHCHVEDVGHVQMGMTGIVFVRPLQDGTPFMHEGREFTRFAYNDGDGSTGFDREFVMFLSEVWAESHWADAHIQLPEWSDYRPDFSLLNGRAYPDTLAPNSGMDPALIDRSLSAARDAAGDLVPTPGYEHLQYQPVSSLVRCNAGERVLLRFANLGFREAAMTTPGLRMRVVGKDATPMRGRGGADTSYATETVSFGAGESVDALFTAPAWRGPGPYDRYVLFNRALTRADGIATGSGQRTEIHVYPAGGVGPQQFPNDWA